MTPQEAEKILYLKARDSLELFGNLVFRTDDGKPLIAHGIHKKLIRNLEALERGDFRRLLEAFPPRHGKSVWSTQVFAAWCIGRNPNIRILLIANTAAQAEMFSVVVREIVTSEAFLKIFPGIEPDKDKGWNKDSWFIKRTNRTADPTMASMGPDGAVISRGADLLICDDVCDSKNTSTMDQIIKVNTNMQVTAQSRLAPKTGRHLVIGHTWHNMDYYAQCEARKSFTVFKHSAILYAGTDHEESLCPEMWPLVELREIRDSMPLAVFEATYQQDPTALTEQRTAIKPHMIKWLSEAQAWELKLGHVVEVKFGERIVRLNGAEMKIGIVVDPAEKLKSVNDFFCASVIGNIGMDWFGLDVIHGRWRYTEIKDRMRDLIRRWQPLLVGVEDKAGGEQLYQELCAEMPDLVWIRLTPIKDKLFRARTLINSAETDRLYLSEAFRKHEIEIISFPFGEHDDVVDTLAYGTQFKFGNVQEHFIEAFTNESVISIDPYGDMHDSYDMDDILATLNQNTYM